MKLGILGTGMIVQDMLRMLGRTGIEAVDILGTENTREQTEELCRQYSLRHAVYDYGQMLSSDIDTVYVALPNHLHYSFAKRALEAGKHVIVEKPATSNPRELRELLTLAENRDLFLLEAMNIHFLPAYRALKENLPALGEIKIVTFNYSQYSSRYDAFKRGEILPAFDPARSGGALMDLNVYNLHAIVGLFGRPASVHYQANIERGIDTSGILTLGYEGFQVVAIGAKDCKAPVTSTIQGNRGYVRISIPVNQLRSYELNDNLGNGAEKSFEEEHRLLYEFIAFREIIEGRNREEANRLQEISMTVSEIMYEARKQKGIVFAND